MAKKNDTRTDNQGVAHTDVATGDGNNSATTKATSGSSNKPIRVFRSRGVKVAVFENHTADNVFYKVSPQKVYREGDEWKTTTSYGRDDLPVARLLLERAWEFILEMEAQPAADGGSHG